ncbi:MAG TPA: hypothetical protein VM345_17920 [Acidimicrobiales bacterium]|nr:hypothetical protein [Acidimicrobiales bacterium]
MSDPSHAGIAAYLRRERLTEWLCGLPPAPRSFGEPSGSVVPITRTVAA